jgi:hypothetical protein
LGFALADTAAMIRSLGPVGRRSLDMTIGPRKQSEKLSDRDKAFLLFGKAMAAWAALEMSFYIWFEHAMLLDMRQAKPLYYAATNFKARLDLLRAAISSTKLEKEEQAFIEAAIKKAIKYSSFRNKLAHGEFTLEGLLIESKHADYKAARSSAITQREIETAARNFSKLAELIADARDYAIGLRDMLEEDSLEICRQRVIELPLEAHSSTQNSMPAKR